MYYFIKFILKYYWEILHLIIIYETQKSIFHLFYEFCRFFKINKMFHFKEKIYSYQLMIMLYNCFFLFLLLFLFVIQMLILRQDNFYIVIIHIREALKFINKQYNDSVINLFKRKLKKKINEKTNETFQSKSFGDIII